MVVDFLALYGFRTALECTGKAARPNQTSTTGILAAVTENPGT